MYIPFSLKISFALSVLLSSFAYGQKGITVYKYTSAEGIVSFSDQPPKTTTYEQLNYGCYACQVNSMVDWHRTKLYPEKFNETILTAAVLNSLDPALIKAIIHAESHFKPSALSKQGAQGLMQIMPATAQELGLKNAFNAQENIKAGSLYLAKLMRRFHGNITLAAAAYNAGPNAVKKYKGVPPFPETQVYVKRVAILYKRYQALS